MKITKIDEELNFYRSRSFSPRRRSNDRRHRSDSRSRNARPGTRVCHNLIHNNYF